MLIPAQHQGVEKCKGEDLLNEDLVKRAGLVNCWGWGGFSKVRRCKLQMQAALRHNADSFSPPPLLLLTCISSLWQQRWHIITARSSRLIAFIKSFGVVREKYLIVAFERGFLRLLASVSKNDERLPGVAHFISEIWCKKLLPADESLILLYFVRGEEKLVRCA